MDNPVCFQRRITFAMKIHWHALRTSTHTKVISRETGSVKITTEIPAVWRPLCEARPNIVRQLYFLKIAVRSAIRSTRQTAERIEVASL